MFGQLLQLPSPVFSTGIGPENPGVKSLRDDDKIDEVWARRGAESIQRGAEPIPLDENDVNDEVWARLGAEPIPLQRLH